MFPHVGVGGTTPRPRNESVASNTIDDGISSVRYTRTGATRFGKISETMIRTPLAPTDRAASTYSRSLSEIVCPRTIRPTDAQLKNAITPITTPRLGPTIETSAIPKSRNGDDRITAIVRERKLSTTPPA